MKLILGRIIVSDNTIKELLSKKNITIVTVETEYTEDLSCPTLIIGWYKCKELFGDQVSILKRTIKPNLYWTFAPNEKLQYFNEDTEKFVQKLYKDLIKPYKYQFIDPIIDNIINIDHVLRYSNNDKYDCVYLTEDFIYMFNEEEKLILGIDINYYKKLRFNIDKITFVLLGTSDITLTEDYTDDGVYQSYKKILNIDFEKKYIPLLETKKC